ncbi:hypothetical protein D9757_004310 [Collybiopsis confluens]|uniref:DUF7082 domain-containing protein n=1 Tax=Collybiopsis confluens TaxID=2823264 RepID=A0A8H5HUC3_9AGAR|nr:hypothetical protein D9757_004310 [Collybiopsis confluens]
MTPPLPVESQVQALTELYNRVQKSRQLPGDLLKSAIVSNSLSLSSPSLSLYSQQLKDIGQTLLSDTVQTALRSADASAQADGQNISNNVRRENRKRRRAPSPESPQPYTGVAEDQDCSLFPLSKQDVVALKRQDLIEYVREFNKGPVSGKLGIWQATRSASREIKNPGILRFSVKDVLTAYLTVSCCGDDPALLVENVTAFGPREKKLPHSQSDYSVYRILSQEVGRMIHSDPQVALQTFMTLLCSYENLFTMRCDKCERVLSVEGHGVAVKRVWNEGNSELTSGLGLVSISFLGGTMIHVLEYSPNEGEPGIPISVRLHLTHSSPDPVFLRLLIAGKPLATKVRELPSVAYGKWQLDATAPALNHGLAADKAILSVQALDKENNLMDNVIFGEFSYWLSNRKQVPAPSHHHHHQHRRHGSIDSKLNIQSPASSVAPFTGRRRANTTATSSASPIIIKAESPKPRGFKKEAMRRIRVNSLMRAKYPVCKDVDEDLYAQTPLLQIVTSLDVICADWDPIEQRAGRRLVKFTKVQDGRKLIVSCEPVSQDDYRETESVISCIYREETQSYYVTSVDIIYLLERLTSDEFPVEEKNRIRRNLEGLRPITVSKHKQGFEKFFHRIMEFPDPKPRNIEKDLKVFEWSLLGQALDKILSKYHVYTSSPTDSTVSLPLEPSDDFPPYTSIEHQVIKSNRPPDDYPELVNSSPPPLKFEPFDDRALLFLEPHDNGLESLTPNPTTPFMFDGSGRESRSTPENRPLHLDDSVLTGKWTPPERLGSADLGIGDYRHLSVFHLAEPGEAPHLSNNDDAHGYESYQNSGLPTYTFHGIADPSPLPPYF